MEDDLSVDFTTPRYHSTRYPLQPTQGPTPSRTVPAESPFLCGHRQRGGAHACPKVHSFHVRCLYVEKIRETCPTQRVPATVHQNDAGQLDERAAPQTNPSIIHDFDPGHQKPTGTADADTVQDGMKGNGTFARVAPAACHVHKHTQPCHTCLAFCPVVGFAPVCLAEKSNAGRLHRRLRPGTRAEACCPFRLHGTTRKMAG